MRTLEIPSLTELLDNTAPEPKNYVYNKSYEEIKDLPLAIMHTSGSTGMPKPRYLTTEWANVGASHGLLPPVNGKITVASKVFEDRRAYMGVPPWHAAGLTFTGLAGCLIGNMTYVCGPANKPPFGATAMDVVRYARVDYLLVKYVSY
jgi:acyl-coenzyme A synthetase/AMP-(fatty) acid ligase